jgi:hypothetical protein
MPWKQPCSTAAVTALLLVWQPTSLCQQQHPQLPMVLLLLLLLVEVVVVVCRPSQQQQDQS